MQDSKGDERMTLEQELRDELSRLNEAADKVLTALDYAATLKRGAWVQDWLFGDNDSGEHAAIAQLRALVRATKQPPHLGFCPRCWKALDNLSPGISVLADGTSVCTPCLKLYAIPEEVARSK